VLVESGLPDLCSCATPVVPELGGKDGRKPPSFNSSTVPSRATHTPVRDRCSSRCSLPPSLVFPPPSGTRKKKNLSLRRCPVGAHGTVPKFSHVPCPSSSFFHDLCDRVVTGRTLPRWFTLLIRGCLYKLCAVTITLGTMPQATYR
jgi:hypothetical protein